VGVVIIRLVIGVVQDILLGVVVGPVRVTDDDEVVVDIDGVVVTVIVVLVDIDGVVVAVIVVLVDIDGVVVVVIVVLVDIDGVFVVVIVREYEVDVDGV
jgi:hypothetical protein